MTVAHWLMFALGGFCGSAAIFVLLLWTVGKDKGGEYVDSWYKIEQCIDVSTCTGKTEVKWIDCLYKGKACRFENYWAAAKALKEYPSNREYRIVRVVEQNMEK